MACAKRKKPANHTPRSKVYLEKLGFSGVETVEKWLHWCKRKKDAFGFGDLLAFNFRIENGYKGIWLIQVTSHENHTARVKKAISQPAFMGWCDSTGRVAVLSWRKVNNRWMPRFQELTKSDGDSHGI